jgi:methylglutaconyl-CoA hydratase
MEAALCCDLRVASSLAKLGLPETGLAIIPGAGGTQRLPRLIGISKAKELIFTGRILDCKEARDIGLVNFAVEASEEGASSPIDAAYEKAKEVASTIIKKGPVAQKAAKTSIDLGSQTDLAFGLKIEELCYGQCIPTKDRIEGLESFLKKRAPAYKGF